MMNEFLIGAYAVSMAGHDSGKYYVIYQTDHEYVYLVDGKIRTLDRPKKKKRMHIQILEQSNHELTHNINSKTVTNEQIKRALKLLYYGNSSKEVE